MAHNILNIIINTISQKKKKKTLVHNLIKKNIGRQHLIFVVMILYLKDIS